jgi:S1/P1 Nuclease
MRARVASAIVGCLLAVAYARIGFGWGPEGHGLVAAIAEAHLEHQPKMEVLRLLSAEKLTHLDEISSWADAERVAKPETGPGHFVDIPLKAKQYSRKRDCHYDKDDNRVPDLTCIVVMLPQWAAVLADKTKGDPQRLEALKWVVHFAGDIHQPLHAENNNDKGGNKVDVTYYGEDTELHAIWDRWVIEHHYGWTLGPNFSFDHQAVRKAAQAIDNGISKSARTTWLAQGGSTNLNTETPQWANWSHHLALQAYNDLPAPPRPQGWENAYQKHAWPVIKTQISAAGIRLAGILNAALK